jgi:hypothetical protein
MIHYVEATHVILKAEPVEDKELVDAIVCAVESTRLYWLIGSDDTDAKDFRAACLPAIVTRLLLVLSVPKLGRVAESDSTTQKASAKVLVSVTECV